MADDVWGGAEVDIAELQRGELGEPHSGGDGDLDERVVATSGHGGPVRGGRQGGDLGRSEVGDVAAMGSFRRDREDSADRGGELEMVGGVGEQRMHRCLSSSSR
jgi:hypothetical protein